MSSTMIFSRFRACTRSIQTPGRAVSAARLSSIVSNSVSNRLSLPFIPSIAETLEFCITTGYPFRHA